MWKFYTNDDCSGTPAATWDWKLGVCTKPPNDAIKNEWKNQGSTCELYPLCPTRIPAPSWAMRRDRRPGPPP